MVVKIAVVGAGIIGMSSAIIIQERFPDAKVFLFAEKFSPGTTSDGAAGLWWPFLLGDTPEKDIFEYARGTWKYLEELWKSPSGGQLGVSLLPCIQTSDTVMAVPSVGDFVYGFQTLTPEELGKFNKPEWKVGYRFVTFICEASRLLPYFLEKFKSRNGVVVSKHLESLEQIADKFDIIINCAGLGAHQLNNDKSMYPIRGHIFRVKAPWQKSILIDDSDTGNYVIPNQETVVLGGTHDKDQWDLEPRESDARFIRDGCNSLFPSLEKAEVVLEWIGLRPGRQTLRVERENRVTINGKHLAVIHNYGHGGSGLTLFWGCALKVADLVQQAMADQLTSRL